MATPTDSYTRALGAPPPINTGSTGRSIDDTVSVSFDPAGKSHQAAAQAQVQAQADAESGQQAIINAQQAAITAAREQELQRQLELERQAELQRQAEALALQQARQSQVAQRQNQRGDRLDSRAGRLSAQAAVPTAAPLAEAAYQSIVQPPQPASARVAPVAATTMRVAPTTYNTANPYAQAPYDNSQLVKLGV